MVTLVAAAALPTGARAEELLVVQANVGNVNVSACLSQVFKLCQRPVERRATAAFAELRPDLVAFQEILPPDLCQRAPSSNPNNLCSGPLDPPSQVVRLLGPGYAQRCDNRFGWDCLALRSDRAALGRVFTRPVLEACSDTGFTLNVGYLRIRGWPVTITDAHPDSSQVNCRAEQLRDFFERALPARGPAIVLGDFNLDPYREDDASVRYWKTQVPARFRYASTDAFTLLPGPSQLEPTGEALDAGGATSPPPLGMRTIDHVLVRDGVSGSCEVRRVDGGGGMDHRAQVCRIELGAAVTPRLRLSTRGCSVRATLTPTPPWLVGVHFRTGPRAFLDRRPPYELPRVGGERAHAVRVAARAVLPNGRGPRALRTVSRCG